MDGHKELSVAPSIDPSYLIILSHIPMLGKNCVNTVRICHLGWNEVETGKDVILSTLT